MRLISYNKAFHVVGYAVIPPFHYSIEGHPVELKDFARLANLEALWAFATDWNCKLSLRIVKFFFKVSMMCRSNLLKYLQRKVFCFNRVSETPLWNYFEMFLIFLSVSLGIKLCFRFTLGGRVRLHIGYDVINLKVNSSHGFLHKPVTKT